MIARMKAMTHYLVDDRANMAQIDLAERSSKPFLDEGESSHG